MRHFAARLTLALAVLLAAPLAAQTPPRGAPIAAWTYIVQPGDTFASIARRWGVDMKTLGEANDVPSPYIIRVGQVLKRPGPKDAPKPKAVPSPRPTALPTPRPAPIVRAREADAPTIGWPTEGALVSHFADTVAGLPNNGIDLVAHPGTRVRAAAAGTVIYAGAETQRYGQLILIDHGEGWVTAYAYLGRFTVKEGDAVKAGERIALVGRSGEAKKPTMHFELRRNNVPRDPELYLPPRL